jgi:hypothetical protein
MLNFRRRLLDAFGIITIYFLCERKKCLRILNRVRILKLHVDEVAPVGPKVHD